MSPAAGAGRWLAGLLAGLVWAGLAGAAELRADPDNYRQMLRQLQPGDRLLLSAGDYRQGLPVHHLAGRADAPIVIEGPAADDAAGRARFLARRGANTVSLVDAQHIVIRNLVLDGQHLPVHAVKAEGHARFAHFITLEGLHIHDHAASQQHVGISTKAPAVGWVVRGNRIERVGTGMYFGDSDGSAPFVAGLIEGNLVRATLGYNLQIKHQLPRPEHLPLAGTRQDTVIRGNVFSKAGSLPGPMARPNVLVGHFPLHGAGSQDRYLIHANLFWHNPSEALFQGEGNLAIHNNLFVTDGPDAVRIRPHNDVPRAVVVAFNTVLAGHNGITVVAPQPQAAGHRQRVVANAVFAARPLSGGEAEGNLGMPHARAERFLRAPFAAAAELDLAPRPGRMPKVRMARELIDQLPQLRRDWLGRPRPASAPVPVGALAQTGASPLARAIPWPDWHHETW